LFLPKTVAHHGDLFLLAQGFRRKNAANRGSHAEHSKEIGGDAGKICPDRLDPTSDRLRTTGVSGNRFETVVSRDEVIEIRLRERHPASRFVQLVDFDETFLVRIRHWPQENGVEHTEDRGRRADAEREREDRDESEGGRFKESAEGVFQIIHNEERRWDRLSWRGERGTNTPAKQRGAKQES